MSDIILSIEQFSKYFRSHWTFRPIKAVEQLSLDIFRGESFGFLGPNGAGKTTTIKSIVGLLPLSSGRILYEGKDCRVAANRCELGFLPELPYFYDHLSVAETLDFFGRLHGLPGSVRRRQTDELLELVGLKEKKQSPVRALSKGLQQRLGFAQAMLNRPKLLLLDEPFSGLDPHGRMEMRNLILDLKKQGTTIFLSSHILADVEHLCDRVAIMSRGQLKTVFLLRDAARLFGETFELAVKGLKPDSHSSRTLIGKAAGHRVQATADEDLHVFSFAHYEDARDALLSVTAEGLAVYNFRSVGKSLEDIFVAITAGENTASLAAAGIMPEKERTR